MEVVTLQEEIDEISMMMYQNREEEVLKRFGDISQKLKRVTDALLDIQGDSEGELLSFIVHMYQTLNRAYQHKDMLGMADCLQEYATLAVELYKSRC